MSKIDIDKSLKSTRKKDIKVKRGWVIKASELLNLTVRNKQIAFKH